EGQARLEVAADGADVLPVAVEQVRLHLSALEEVRKNLHDQVLGGVSRKQVDQELTAEQVDPHVRQVLPVTLDALLSQRLGGRPQELESIRRGLFDDLDDPPDIIDANNADRRSLVDRDRSDRDRQVRLAADVGRQQVAKVHAVQLVAGQHQD